MGNRFHKYGARFVLRQLRNIRVELTVAIKAVLEALVRHVGVEKLHLGHQMVPERNLSLPSGYMRATADQWSAVSLPQANGLRKAPECFPGHSQGIVPALRDILNIS